MTSIEIPTYPTQWAGDMTFDAIYADLRKEAFISIRGNCHLYDQGALQQAVQTAFIALFKQLRDDPHFLATRTRRDTAYFLACRSNPTLLKNEYKRGLETESVSEYWAHPESLHHVTGLETGHDPHAVWASRVDFQVDVERLMHALAARYAHSFPHLVALYASTTQVTLEDAADMVRYTTDRVAFLTIAYEVQTAVREAFANTFLEQPLPTPSAPQLPTPLKAYSFTLLDVQVYTVLKALYARSLAPIKTTSIIEWVGRDSAAVRASLHRLVWVGAAAVSFITRKKLGWTPVQAAGDGLRVEVTAALPKALFKPSAPNKQPALPCPAPAPTRARFNATDAQVYAALKALYAKTLMPVRATTIATQINRYRNPTRESLHRLMQTGAVSMCRINDITFGWTPVCAVGDPLLTAATTPHTLNATDWRVYTTLKQLCRTTPLVLSAALYAAHAEHSKATITSALRKLERAGLVEREGHGTRTLGWRVAKDAAAAPIPLDAAAQLQAA